MRNKHICDFAFDIHCLGIWNNPMCTNDYANCEQYKKLEQERIEKYLNQKKQITELVEYNKDWDLWEKKDG